MRCPSISNQSFNGNAPNNYTNFLGPKTNHESLNASVISFNTNTVYNGANSKIQFNKMMSGHMDRQVFGTCGEAPTKATLTRNHSKSNRRCRRERSSSDQFRVQGTKEKPLYLKNMEFLLKKARENSISRRLNDVQSNVLQKAEGLKIPDGLYYMSKLLNSLLLRSNEYYCKAYIEHFGLTCQSVLYVKDLEAPNIDSEELKSKSVELPGDSGGKKTLILDLDETLVHCSKENTDNCDITLLIALKTGKLVKVRESTEINIPSF